MAIPNLIALFALGPVVFGLTKEFFNKNYSPLTPEQIPANSLTGGQKL